MDLIAALCMRACICVCIVTDAIIHVPLFAITLRLLGLLKKARCDNGGQMAGEQLTPDKRLTQHDHVSSAVMNKL